MWERRKAIHSLFKALPQNQILEPSPMAAITQKQKDAEEGLKLI